MKINSAPQCHHNVPNVVGALLLTIALVNFSLIPEASSAARVPPDGVQQLVDKAHSAPMETRAPYLLDAADFALQQNSPESAERVLKEIDELSLSDDQRARSHVLRAQLLLLQRKPEQALTILQTKELQQDSAQLPTRAQIQISLLRAQAFADSQNYYASAQERIFVDPLLQDSEAAKNHEAIQHALMQLSTGELQQNRDRATNEKLRGWLELALAAKAGDTSTWAKKWAAHPATNQVIASTPTSSAMGFRPHQIALLLPQSGKLANFGDAVRDGFFAALYAAKPRGEQLPSVRIYNTEGAGVVGLYQQAVSDGAALVIGPLEKNLVAQFYSQTLPVPLLALNRADTDQAPPANLYQLALAPEDETAAIALLAAKENRANALVIVSEDDAHSRELEAFKKTWESQGGHIGATALYRDQQTLSTAIRSALNIPRSEARGKEMETLLNRNIESTPHRRRDIDMVFMLAKPTQARLIKPLLDFYYAGDLPIYSTSRIYAGYPVANADRDIEKVRFTEIPFVLQKDGLKEQILNARPAGKNYLRLYALGIDSFNFYPLLNLPSPNSANAQLNGQTGALALDAQRIVQRGLPLAEMRGGVPHIIDGNGTLATPGDLGNETSRDGNGDQQNTATP